MNQGITLPNNVDYIFHIADIHIRNWKRHKEFRQVFDKMFEELDKCSPNTIVTVGGDIVHAKTEMSPELISMVSYLFKRLADRRPTFVITGNHDANLNNTHRLDALTPIIQGLKHRNLWYLRDSGLYDIYTPVHKIGLSVFSLLGETDKYITYDKIDNPDQYDLLMALYHGTVANSKVDSGMNIEHGLSWDTFAGFDVAPLGDIHKRQVLSTENPLMFYPGSTVQQNFGEAYEGHGYGIIDVRDLAELHVAAAENVNASGRYFGVNQSYKWEEILNTFSTVYKSYTPPPRFEGDAKIPTQFDHSRKNSLGVTLRPLEETLRDLITFMKERNVIE